VRERVRFDGGRLPYLSAAHRRRRHERLLDEQRLLRHRHGDEGEAHRRIRPDHPRFGTVTLRDRRRAR
jgi:hypothetical protein